MKKSITLAFLLGVVLVFAGNAWALPINQAQEYSTPNVMTFDSYDYFTFYDEINDRSSWNRSSQTSWNRPSQNVTNFSNTSRNIRVVNLTDSLATANGTAARAPIETPVPEPATLVLLGIGLIGLAGIGRRKAKK